MRHLVLGHSPSPDDQLQKLSLEIDEDDAYTMEYELRRPYSSTFDAYADMYLQFAYIVLFGVVVPLFAIFSLLECLIRMRVDAFRLCYLSRRANVEQAEDTGLWTENLSLVAYIGAFLSVAVFTFTEANTSNYSLLVRFIAFMAFGQVMILYILKVESYVAPVSDETEDILARQDYVINKFIKGCADDDEALGGHTVKGNVDDRIDMEGLNLFDLKHGLVVTDEDFSEIERLEAKKFEILREMKLVKDRLQDALKAERFNDALGIGETRHGLPLGRLSVKLIEVRNFADEVIDRDLGNKPQLKLRIEIKGTKPGAPAPVPEFGALAETPILHVNSSKTIPINRSLGPFAPIRTIHADIIFNFLNMAPKAFEANVATVVVPLRELSDQAQHDMVLPLRLRDLDGSLKPSSAQLYANLIFEYSKVVPIRNKIFVMQDKINTIDRDLARLRGGH